ncbi:MAG TPA: cysteine desulfurase family protein [Candidatus Acidoferrales bacterium]|nr:cysteine desulfurase family protein [Candidatus Acidoferrales bacterium]
MRRIYLDYAATTPTDKRVVEAMTPYFSGIFGNASSIHGFGREAKSALENSRARIAGLIGARESELFFTSGGTESDNSALFGVAAKFSHSGKKHLIISSIEHHAIFNAAESLRKSGFDVTVLPVDAKGFVSRDELEDAITDETFLVSIIHANNEIGTIQNLPELIGAAHDRGVLFHTDAVQSFCKTRFDVNKFDVDLASFTAHKIYGPKGIGALYIKRGIDFEPMFHGGSQERNRRPGTESVPLAVGFAKAGELCAQDSDKEQMRLSEFNLLLRNKISAEIPEVIINSPEESSLPNILSVSINSSEHEIDGEALIINMDLEGVAVTSGSACSSGSLQPSHVIKAIGRDDKTTMATVRFSFGRFTTEDDITTAAEKFVKIVNRIGKRKPN